MSEKGFINSDPTTGKMTNSWSYDQLKDLRVVDASETQFQIVLPKDGFFGGKTMTLTFNCANRTYALGLLYGRWHRAKKRPVPRFGNVTKLGRSAAHRKLGVTLEVGPCALHQIDAGGRRVGTYAYRNIERLALMQPAGFIIYTAREAGRLHAFACLGGGAERDSILDQVRTHAARLGLARLADVRTVTLATEAQYFAARANYAAQAGIGPGRPPPVAEFAVNKVTPKHTQKPVPRRLVVTERTIVEQDADTSDVRSVRPLTEVFAVVRPWDDPQQLFLEYNDGATRQYLSAQRDLLLACVLDGARLAGNTNAKVVPEQTDASARLCPRYKCEAGEPMETLLTKRVAAVAKEVRKEAGGKGGLGGFGGRPKTGLFSGPYCKPLVDAATALNENCGGTYTAAFGAKRNAVQAALAPLAFELRSVMRLAAAPASVVCHLLRAVTRLASTQCGFAMSGGELGPATGAGLADALAACVGSSDECVVFWAITAFNTLCRRTVPGRPRDTASEHMNKQMLLTESTCRALVGLLESRGCGVEAHRGQLILMPLIALFESVLCSQRDSTPADVFNGLLGLVGAQYKPLLGLCRSPVESTVQDLTLLMRAIVEDTSREIACQMQDAALCDGILLRHFRNALYSLSQDQRYISRYLVALWVSGNQRGLKLLARIVPRGLLHYLDMPMLSERECDALLELEAAEHDDEFAPVGEGSGRTRRRSSSTSRSSKGLRERIERAGKVKLCGVAGGLPPHLRSDPLVATTGERQAGESRGAPSPELAAASPVSADQLQQNQAAAAKLWDEADQLEAAGNAEGALVKLQILAELFPENLKVIARIERLAGASGVPHPGPASRQTTSAARGEERSEPPSVDGRSVPPKSPRERRSSSNGEGFLPAHEFVSNRGDGDGSEHTLRSIRERTNFAVFFHMCTQDNSLPDLIWNQETRAELRDALAAEIAEFEREKDLAGGSALCWNHLEFTVDYPSLANELCVGGCYVRLLLEAGDTHDGKDMIRQLRRADKFFMALYHRFLREHDNDTLQLLCLRAMQLVHDAHAGAIGPFDEVEYVVEALGTVRHRGIRDRLLLLLQSLITVGENAETIVNDRSGKCVSLLVSLAAMAHTDKTIASAPLHDEVKKNAQTKRIVDATHTVGATAADGSGVGSGGMADEATAKASGGREAAASGKPIAEWYFKIKGKGGRKVGPLPFYELRNKYEEGKRLIRRKMLLAATGRGDDQGSGEKPDVTEHTLCWAAGMPKWRKLKDVRQLHWSLLMDGEPALSQANAAAVALRLLLRLVQLHASTSEDGAPMRPQPRVKRMLATHACLPHIAQTLLTGHAGLIDAAADLLLAVCEHNPAAMDKLYLTGIFFFALRYGGSNFAAIARLVHATHLRQNFREGREALSAHAPVSQRSILGSMLPEAMLCILENYGQEKFAETFTGNFDNPEVIWKYEMRRHLCEMLDQHIAGFDRRLADNTHALFDWVPVPNVVYTDLEPELWCMNYFLRNLCDEVRFPDWPIIEPVELLRFVLDAWMQETSKEPPETTEDEALAVLGLSQGGGSGDHGVLTPHDIRKAYRKLARKFHPDRNPDGQETFLKIQKAYELLTSVRGAAFTQKADPVNIFLLVKVQVILFRRFAPDFAPYKYAGYRMLVDALCVRVGEDLRAQQCDLFAAASELVYLTCAASPLNAEELTRENGVETLAKLLSRMLDGLVTPDTDPTVKAHKTACATVSNIARSFSGLGAFALARDRVATLPSLVRDIVRTMHLALPCPRGVHYALEACARCAVAPALQDSFLAGGVLWSVLPLMMAFDSSLDLSGEALKAAIDTSTIAAGNVAAKLAAHCCSRLGGYLHGNERLTSPQNRVARQTLTACLTPPLARYLVRTKPTALLKLMTGNTETPLIIFNAAMRSELRTLCDDQWRTLNEAPAQFDPHAGVSFKYSTLRPELKIGDVYVRVFVDVDPEFALEDPQGWCEEILMYLWTVTAPGPNLPGVSSLFDPRPGHSLLGSGNAGTDEEAGVQVGPEQFVLDLRRIIAACDRSTASTRSLLTELARQRGVDAVKPHKKALKMIIQRLVSSGNNVQSTGQRGADAQPLPSAPSGKERGSEITRAEAAILDGERGRDREEMLARVELALRAVRLLVTTGGGGRDGGFGAHRALATYAGPSTGGRAGDGSRGLPVIYAFLEEDADTVPRTYSASSTIRNTALAVAASATQEGCPATVAVHNLSGHLLHLLRKSVPGTRDTSLGALRATAAATAAVVKGLIELGAVVDLLALLLGGGEKKKGERFAAEVAASRPLCAALLGILVREESHGPLAWKQLLRFVPEGIAHCFKEDPSGAVAVATFDNTLETPDLIWNTETRADLGRAVLAGEGALWPDCMPPRGEAWAPPAGNYRVKYHTLDQELFLGGVYVRVFLKDPKFNLRNARRFAQALLKAFTQECERRISDMRGSRAATAAANVDSDGENPFGDDEDDSVTGGGGDETEGTMDGDSRNQLVRAKHDDALLSPVTSGIVCLMKVRTTMMDYAAQLGYATQAVALLEQVAPLDPQGVVAMSCLRVVHTFVDNPACGQAMAGRKLGAHKKSIVTVLLDILGPPLLDASALIVLESLRLLLEKCAGAMLVSQWLADHGAALHRIMKILTDEREPGGLASLEHSGQAKVYLIKVVKHLEADPTHGTEATNILLGYPVWQQYQHQRQDLFVAPSVKQKADLRLTYGSYNPNKNNLIMDTTGGGGGATNDDNNNGAGKSSNLTLAKFGNAPDSFIGGGANAGLRAGRQAYDDGPPLFDSSSEDEDDA